MTNGLTPSNQPLMGQRVTRSPARFLRAAVSLGCLLMFALLRPARGLEPLSVVDFSTQADVAAGPAMASWFDSQKGRIDVKFGGPAYFFLRQGSLHLVAKPGPFSSSILLWRLLKREDKVILRLTPDGFRVSPRSHRRIEVTMAPVRLPGHGADVTDSDRNDACFYLLVAFDGPRHLYQGQRIPDTLAYVWADGAWKTGAEVGRERKYGDFMRHIAIGRGPDRLAELRTVVRDIDADFRLAYPERADKGVPDVVEVGLMIDSNTVKSDAESMLRSVRFLP